MKIAAGDDFSCSYPTCDLVSLSPAWRLMCRPYVLRSWPDWRSAVAEPEVNHCSTK